MSKRSRSSNWTNKSVVSEDLYETIRTEQTTDKARTANGNECAVEEAAKQWYVSIQPQDRNKQATGRALTTATDENDNDSETEARDGKVQMQGVDISDACRGQQRTKT